MVRKVKKFASIVSITNAGNRWPDGRVAVAGWPGGRGRVAVVAVAGWPWPWWPRWPWPGGRVAVAVAGWPGGRGRVAVAVAVAGPWPWPGWPATKKGYCARL